MEEDCSSQNAVPFAFLRASDRARLGALRPRKEAVQERSRQTVEVVLEAAAQVFEQLGFEAATTERIAARAGVSVGSLYQYWPNKNALAVALMERHGQECLTRLLPSLRGLDDVTIPLEARIEAVVRVLIEQHDERPDLVWTLETQASIPELYRERIGELNCQLSAGLARLLGISKDQALLVTCALDALPHALIRPATRLGREPSVRELTRMLVAYLKACGAV